MELRHVRYFVVVAQELHFGRAARRLHMSQSPLSARIRELEREVGGELLRRSTREVSLTPLGEVFLRHAYQVLEAVCDLEDAVAHEIEGAATEDLARVGLLPGHVDVATATQYYKEALAENIHVEFHSLSSVEQLNRLLEGRLDLGFVLHSEPLRDDSCHVLCELTKPLGLVVSNEHRLSGRTSAAMSELTGEALVMFNRDRAPDVHDHLLAVVKAAGFIPTRIYYMAPLHPSVVSVAQGVLFHERDVAEAAGLAWIPLVDVDLCWRAAIVARQACSPSALAAGRLLEATMRKEGWVSE